MSKFVHLHTHSHYSLLEAIPKIPDLIKKAKKSGMSTLALTDSGNLYGAIEFYKECKDSNIKPIIGVDFYVAKKSRLDKEGRMDAESYRVVLLAENNKGYENLLKLVTFSYLEGFYYKPRIDRELLEKYNDGLIAISGETKIFEEAFGDRFYLGVHPEDIPNLKNQTYKQMVADYNVHYLELEDKPILETLSSIQGHTDRNQNFREERDLSFIDAKKAIKDFKDFPEAIENTVKIAERCNLNLELGKWVFPKYEIAEGSNYKEEFRKSRIRTFNH